MTLKEEALTLSEQRWLGIGLLAIVVAALFVRLLGIDSIGVGGNDTILYYTLAEQWLEGELAFRVGESKPVYRPVYLGINAISLWLAGHTDYALKLGNVVLDTLALILLARLAWLFSHRAAVVLTTTTAYAFLPLAIWATRQELPHTASTFLMLLTFVLFAQGMLAGNVGRSAGYFLASGLFLGAATLCHEELVLAAIPLGFFILLARGRAAAPSLTDNLRNLLAFLSMPILAGVLAFLMQESFLRRLLARTVADFGGEDSFYPEMFGRFFWNAMRGSTSTTVAVLVLLCLVYILGVLLTRRGRDASTIHCAAGICLVLPMTFVALYTPFFNTIFSRGFLPFAPLLLLGVFLCFWRIFAPLPLVLRGFMLVILLVVVMVSNLASYSAFAIGNRRYGKTWASPVWPGPETLKTGWQEFLVDARYVPSYATHWRVIYDALSAEVDSSNRLLVLPSTVIYSPGRRPLQTRVYFGDNAVYRLDHWSMSLAEIVEQFDIRWVLFTTGQQRKLPKRIQRYLYQGRWAPAETVDLARAYGMSNYSTQREYQDMVRFLGTADAVPQALFETGTYESQVTRIWRLP